MTGVIVDDFGELPHSGTVIGDYSIRSARRWAVRLDNGALRFVDSSDLGAT